MISLVNFPKMDLWIQWKSNQNVSRNFSGTWQRQLWHLYRQEWSQEGPWERWSRERHLPHPILRQLGTGAGDGTIPVEQNRWARNRPLHVHKWDISSWDGEKGTFQYITGKKLLSKWTRIIFECYLTPYANINFRWMRTHMPKTNVKLLAINVGR